MAAAAAAREQRRGDGGAGPGWAGGLLGFAFGGFADGILFHQILQWHHLLSAVEGEPFRDIRVQVLADGLFHAAMYAVAAAGLWLLWRARGRLADAGAGRVVTGSFLVGFGVWHVVDAVVNHWVLGLHHIRMAEDPLFWDLVVFALGVALALAGLLLLRGRGAGTPGPGRRPALAPAILAGLVLGAAPLAARPPPGAGPATMVLFRPGTSPADALAAIAAADARTVWSNAAGDVWVVELADGGKAPLFRGGALYVGSSLLPFGCFAPRAG
jgi:uncharacterized membrane protein